MLSGSFASSCYAIRLFCYVVPLDEVMQFSFYIDKSNSPVAIEVISILLTIGIRVSRINNLSKHESTSNCGVLVFVYHSKNGRPLVSFTTDPQQFALNCIMFEPFSNRRFTGIIFTHEGEGAWRVGEGHRSRKPTILRKVWMIR